MKLISLLLALGLTAGGFVAPNTPVAPENTAIEIVGAPASAGVLRPNQALVFSGTITNLTAQTLDDVTTALHVSSSRMVTRSAVSRWLAETSSVSPSRIGAALAETRIPSLAVGQSRSFTVSVLSSSLAFMNGETGAFALEIHVAATGVAPSTHRSVVSWLPDGAIPRVNLAVAAPLNAPPAPTGLLEADELERLTSPGGELYAHLEMMQNHTVAIGVDPMIIASIRLLGDSAPLSAREWLERLNATPHDVFSLTYADSDQLLLHRAGAVEPLGPISFPFSENVGPVPQETDTPDGSATPAASEGDAETPAGDPLAFRTTIDGFLWPDSALKSEADLDFLSAGGFTRTLVSSSDVADYSLATPNALVGKHRITVADDQASKLVATAARASSDSEWDAAAANLTAMLAVTAAQSPGATLVATVDRELAPNTRFTDKTLRAIESLPWVNPTTMTNAFNVASGKTTVVDSTEGEDDDRLALTQALIDSENALTRFSSVADDPTLITGPQRLRLLSLLSSVWLDNLPAWDAAVTQYLTDSDETLNAVRIPEGSFINFPLEKGNLPITVRNELSFPVTVYVTVRAERAILNVTDSWVELNIEANSQTKASVPVESIANGEVLTTVSLSSSTGVQISEPTIVTLNVQAGWETTATVILAGIVILLFGAGIWRTILRQRAARSERTTSDQVAS